MRRLAAAFAVVGTSAALASATSEWPRRSGGESPEQLSSLFPESAAMLRLAIPALVQAERGAEAGAALTRLAGLGYALSPAGQAQLAALIDQASAARFAANAAPRGSPATLAGVPAEFGLVESVVEVGGLMVASSITAQDLIVSRGGKNWRPLGLEGLASPGGLAADRGAGLVWASSARFDQTPRPDGGFIGLVAVDPRRGRVVRRIAAPEGAQPSDILLAPDGTLYASDPFRGGIWRAGQRDAVLRRWSVPTCCAARRGWCCRRMASGSMPATMPMAWR